MGTTQTLHCFTLSDTRWQHVQSRVQWSKIVSVNRIHGSDTSVWSGCRAVHRCHALSRFGTDGMIGCRITVVCVSCSALERHTTGGLHSEIGREGHWTRIMELNKPGGTLFQKARCTSSKSHTLRYVLPARVKDHWNPRRYLRVISRTTAHRVPSSWAPFHVSHDDSLTLRHLPKSSLFLVSC